MKIFIAYSVVILSEVSYVQEKKSDSSTIKFLLQNLPISDQEASNQQRFGIQTFLTQIAESVAHHVIRCYNNQSDAIGNNYHVY